MSGVEWVRGVCDSVAVTNHTVSVSGRGSFLDGAGKKRWWNDLHISRLVLSVLNCHLRVLFALLSPRRARGCGCFHKLWLAYCHGQRCIALPPCGTVPVPYRSDEAPRRELKAELPCAV